MCPKGKNFVGLTPDMLAREKNMFNAYNFLRHVRTKKYYEIFTFFFVFSVGGCRRELYVEGYNGCQTPFKDMGITRALCEKIIDTHPHCQVKFMWPRTMLLIDIYISATSIENSTFLCSAIFEFRLRMDLTRRLSKTYP